MNERPHSPSSSVAQIFHFHGEDGGFYCNYSTLASSVFWHNMGIFLSNRTVFRDCLWWHFRSPCPALHWWATVWVHFNYSIFGGVSKCPSFQPICLSPPSLPAPSPTSTPFLFPLSPPSSRSCKKAKITLRKRGGSHGSSTKGGSEIEYKLISSCAGQRNKHKHHHVHFFFILL